MRFYMLSDLHLDPAQSEEKIEKGLNELCTRLRTEASPNEGLILFAVLGDIINQGEEKAFSKAESCLNQICEHLHDYEVRFEMVPGNHDRHERNVEAFDRFSAKFGVVCNFANQHTYAKEYEGINFIFTDTTWGGEHNEPGHLDMESIKSAVKANCENILFCHHALTQYHVDSHDCVENGEQLSRDLRKMGIRFVFHGHTHQADMTVSETHAVEFGCGSLFQPMDNMPVGTNNQFATACGRDGKIVGIDRLIFTADGSRLAIDALYPKKRQFQDPDEIGKIPYSAIERPHIPRKVLPHENAAEDRLMQAFYGVPSLTLLDAINKCGRILLLSDAGQGKSVELRHLAHEAGQGRFYPFLFSLKDYMGETITELVPEAYREGYHDLHPSRKLLLFDGYDELTSDCRVTFEKQVARYVKDEPEARVLISSRSNFCRAESKNESRTFPGFTIYDFCPISQPDQTEYLRECGIAAEMFFKEASSVGVQGVLDNPFYLSGLVEIYQEDQSLPNKREVMDRLIRLRFCKDDEKYHERLDEKEYQLFALLQKLAFAMQLMHRCDLDGWSEYQRLFCDGDRALMQKSGLLIRNGEKWQFIHNNFREYLAAKELMQFEPKKRISYFSDGKRVLPSWVNTLGYLCSLDEERELLPWLMENAPEALLKFERDRVSAEQRDEILKRLFEYYEVRNLWFENDLCGVDDLARFACSRTSICFLLGKITQHISHIPLCVALQILAEFPRLYGMEKEVCDVLLRSCAESLQSDDGLACQLAMRALICLNMHNPLVTGELLRLARYSGDAYVRFGLYEYLLGSENHNAFYQIFLDGIPYIQNQLNTKQIRIGNEAFTLINGLKSMSTAESISGVLRYLACNTDYTFYDRNEVIANLLQRAVQLYQSGELRLLQDVVFFCFFGAVNGENLKYPICFFHETNTEKDALCMLAGICEKNKMNLGRILSEDESLFENAKELYQEGRLSDDLFIATMSYARNEQYERYRYVILKKSGKELEKRPVRPDYDKIRRQGKEEYFNALFDRARVEKMISEILDKAKDANISVGGLIDKKIDYGYYSPLLTLQYTMGRMVLKNTRVRDFLEVVDWDTFTIVEVTQKLRDEKDLTLTAEQRETLETLLQKRASEGMFDNAVSYDGGNVSIAHDKYMATQLAVLLDCPLLEETLLQMIALPDFCFSNGTREEKYFYLERHIGKDKILCRIADNLREARVNGSVLDDHIDYCRDNCSEIAVETACAICSGKTAMQHSKYAAVKYLYEIKGRGYLETVILPCADSEVLCIVAENYGDISRASLREAMERCYSEKQSEDLQKHLIRFGSRVALEDYVAEVQRTHTLPEREKTRPAGPTDAIQMIDDQNLLPLLGELLDIAMTPGFQDIEFGGLKQGLMRAFQRCAATDTKAAMEELEKHAEYAVATPSSLTFYEYIKENIKQAETRENDKAMKIDEVAAILRISECRASDFP